MQISNEKYYRIIQAVLSKYEYSALPEEVRKGFEMELRIRLSWNTNSLEGNTLTLEETVDALEYDEVRSGHTYSEYTEAKTAYLANCELSFTARKETNLELLHRINGIIMGTDGSFRTRQVYVGSIAEVRVDACKAGRDFRENGAVAAECPREPTGGRYRPENPQNCRAASSI